MPHVGWNLGATYPLVNLQFYASVLWVMPWGGDWVRDRLGLGLALTLTLTQILTQNGISALWKHVQLLLEFPF